MGGPVRPDGYGAEGSIVMEERPQIPLPTPDSSGCVSNEREPSRIDGHSFPPFVYQAIADPTPPKPWSLEADCSRLRDLARRHGFMIRAKDAKQIWEQYSKQSRTSWVPLPESDADLLKLLIEPLHDWLAEDDEPVGQLQDLPVPAGLGRPALIDEQDGPCEICAAWAAKRGVRDQEGNVIVWCEGCGQRITGMELNGGRGIAGCVPHHYHMVQVNGSVPGRRGILQELCQNCAIELRLKVYPPDEKDRFGNFHPTAEQMRSYKG